MAPAIHIGTSGWSYDEWKDGFYAGVRRAGWLAFYAGRFDAVEVNATFYHTLKRSTLQHWCEATPPRFRFAIKASRYLTHVQRLEMSAKSFNLLRGQADLLGEKLAAVLWQLPASLERDLGLLERFARRLDKWSAVRHAVEFRHASWFDEETAACLSAHAIAAVQSDAADWPMWDAVTTDLVYMRLHGGTRTYASAYRAPTLKRWAQRIKARRREGREVHAYFDNTGEGHAVRNALALARLCGS